MYKCSTKHITNTNKVGLLRDLLANRINASDSLVPTGACTCYCLGRTEERISSPQSILHSWAPKYLSLALQLYGGACFEAKLTYRTLNTPEPQYLSQCINRRVNARTLRSSVTLLLIQPFARTDFAKCSF